MVMVWCYDKNVIFVHIPKSGGTSVESYLNLKTKNKSKFDKVGYGIKVINNNRKALQHLTASEIINFIGEENFNKMYKFAIVRDPYSKIISEFSHFLNLSGNKYHGKDSPLLKNGTLITNFDDYLDHVKNIIDNQLYDQNVFYDHFKPQHEFVSIDNKIVLQDIYRFEELDMVKQFLKKKFPKENTNFPHSQKRKKKKIILTSNQKSKIYSMYEADFKLFNYPE